MINFGNVRNYRNPFPKFPKRTTSTSETSPPSLEGRVSDVVGAATLTPGTTQYPNAGQERAAAEGLKLARAMVDEPNVQPQPRDWRGLPKQCANVVRNDHPEVGTVPDGCRPGRRLSES